MSTVQSLYSLVQYRNGKTVSLDDLIHIVNNAVRTIAKRLYWLESDLLREEMSVSVWAQVTHTGTDIVFNNANPDTITSATGGFLTSRLAADMPILETKLSYTSAGEPRYYQVKERKIYIIPAAGADYTIKADYFARPTELTATTDTLPFNEMFDDVMAEYVMRYFRGGIEGQAATVDLNRMLVENVDLIAGKYGRKAAAGMPEGIPWDEIMGR